MFRRGLTGHVAISVSAESMGHNADIHRHYLRLLLGEIVAAMPIFSAVSESLCHFGRLRQFCDRPDFLKSGRQQLQLFLDPVDTRFR